MSESVYLTYHQKNRNVILNRAKDYYQNDNDRLREQARDKYRNLSEDEKNKYLNMSEEKKKGLKEYQKNYHEAKKSQYNNE